MPGTKTWRRGSKRDMIAQFANSGQTRKDAFIELRKLTEQGIEPMVFKANVSGARIAKPLSRQLLELKFEINRVFKILEIAGKDLDTKTEEEEDDTVTIEEEEEDDSEEEDDIVEEEEDVKPVKSSRVKIEDALNHFYAEVKRIRNFCNSRALTGEAIDKISMRPVQAASRLIPAGVPVDALLNAMCLSWPDGAKADASIPNFDFTKFSRKIMEEREIEFGRYHSLLGYALILAENRIPIFLIGDFGTGKSHLAEDLSEYLNVDYAEAPMSSGAMRGDLLGRHTAGPFVTAEFTSIYTQGGVFNFEEIDASDGGLLITLNNALARNVLHNTTTGERLTKSENFIPCATGNTFGLGATREYTAREKQDAATLDRWRMGRIVVPIDEKVEETILFSHFHKIDLAAS
jgi:AAA domain (dynein-related subfamily)